MYDIKPLEEEWNRYNKKKRKPWYLLGLGIIVSTIIFFVIFKFNIMDSFKSSDQNKSVETFSKAEKGRSSSILMDKSLATLELEKSKKNVIAKTLEIKPTTITSYDDPMGNSELYVKEKKIKKPRIKSKVKMVQKPHKKMHLNIIETTSVSAYKDVEKRFYASHDTDDSLFLAKSYYSKGLYKKAEHWALETNKVNGNIEESWLIFTKSKVKLGHKNEAIRLLMSYIKRSNSKKARRLLYKIQKGNL